MAAGIKKGSILRGRFQQLFVARAQSRQTLPRPTRYARQPRVNSGVTWRATLHGFIRRRHGEMDEAAHFFDLFFLDEL